MTTTNVVIIESKQAENVETTQYTSAGLRTIIDKFTGTNTSGSAASLTIKLLPSGGTPGDANLIVTKVLQPSETYTFPEVVAHTLADGGFISTIASAATSITIRASGRQITT